MNTSMSGPGWDMSCGEIPQSSTVQAVREERQEVVASMREIGMSTRAIASATGAGRGTIARELSGVPNGTAATVTGTDGKTYTPKPRPEPEPSPEPDARPVVGTCRPPTHKRATSPVETTKRPD